MKNSTYQTRYAFIIFRSLNYFNEEEPTFILWELRLMTGTHPDLALRGSEPTRLWIVGKAVEKGVLVGLELFDCLEVEAVLHSTPTAQDRHRVDVRHLGDEELSGAVHRIGEDILLISRRQ